MKNYICLDGQAPFQKTGHTSKGDQRKWKIGDIWYKTDYMGYEGLAETLVSHLLCKSTLTYPFVTYDPAEIEYEGMIKTGCRSRDFLKPGQTLLPLEKLYRQNSGESLAGALAGFSEVKDRIRFLTDWVQELTGIEEFGKYLTAILEIDAFFLNEDRHTNNIAVLYEAESDRYTCCPLFDQGLSLYADTTNDYPLSLTPEECRRRIQARPFSRDFDEQLDAAEELYGTSIAFGFSERDIFAELRLLSEYYSGEILDRVEQTLRWQMQKYAYLMKK